MAAATLLAGCGGGGPEQLSTGATTVTSNKRMQITANTSNQGSVSVGQSFALTPQVSGGGGGKLTFTVQNAASWMSFNTSTGVLSGTPSAADAGTYANLVITVSDGKQTASTAPFTVTVLEAASATGTADVSWTPPTTNSDGSTLTNLA
ncbi:putative Ig, partial [mine drainage metagenome]